MLVEENRQLGIHSPLFALERALGFFDFVLESRLDVPERSNLLLLKDRFLLQFIELRVPMRQSSRESCLRSRFLSERLLKLLGLTFI